jgi:predicted KAP-like P-loop ATPase
MWIDAETSRDFLNFRVMAGLTAAMIEDAKGAPLSIGVSGGWGVGKSSMVKLIEKEMRAKKNDKVVFGNFNAWLYQGHDDAKAALMEEISKLLIARAVDNESILTKAFAFFGRVRWFRAIRLFGEAAVTLKTGVPVSLLTNGLESAYEQIVNGEFSADDFKGALDSEGVKKIQAFAKERNKEFKGLIDPKKAPETPPQMIHALRAHLEAQRVVGSSPTAPTIEKIK